MYNRMVPQCKLHNYMNYPCLTTVYALKEQNNLDPRVFVQFLHEVIRSSNMASSIIAPMLTPSSSSAKKHKGFASGPRQ